MADASVAPFSLRHDALAVAVVVVVSVAVRLTWLPDLEAAWDADGANSCLLALHHSQGLFPVFWYSQTYNGSLEGLLAAPWVLAMGPTVQAMGASQVVLATLLAVAIYALARRFTARVGALAGACWYGAGTLPLADNLSGINHSYTLMSLLGIACLVMGRRALVDPSARRLGALGVMAGVSMFNNPQGASFLAPIALAFALRGHAIGRVLGRDGAPTSVGLRWTRVAVVVLGALLALVVGLSVAGVERLELPGGVGVSASRPGQYVMRLVLAAGALFAALELAWSPCRRALVRGAIAFGLGYVLAQAPAIAHKATLEREGTSVRGSGAGLDPSRIPAHLERLLLDHGPELLFNHPAPSDDARRGAPWFPAGVYAAVRTTAMVLFLGALVHVAWRGRRSVVDTLRLRPPATVDLGWLLGVHAAAVVAMYAMFPRDDVYPKYAMSAWVPFAVALAGGAGALADRVPRLACVAAVAWGGQLAASGVLTFAELRGRMLDPTHACHEVRAILDDLDQRGIHEGYANYWHGFRVTYLSGERIVLREWPRVDELGWEGQRPMLPRYHARVEAALAAGTEIAFVTAKAGSGEYHEEQARAWLERLLARRLLVLVLRIERATYDVAIVRRR